MLFLQNHSVSDFIKGIFMGIANIMPGVSGGTLAISFGVYDRMIGAVSNIFRDFRKSFRILFPLLAGMSVGIVCFTYVMEYLFAAYPFFSAMAFAGLILGGMPALWRTWKESLPVKNSGDKNVIPTLRYLPGYAALFLFFAVITVFTSSARTAHQGAALLQADARTPIILFLLGIISAAAMIIPGVSGSLILMVLGYYYGILHAVRSLLEGMRTLDSALFIQNFLLLLPFAAGMVPGIFLFSRLLEYLFRTHAAAVYSAVLGLIAASPAAILIRTGALSKIPPEKFLPGIAVFIFCLFISKKLEN
ncbi:MAG: DUF368 domain-containing protein [Lachnospiraceae bacterium]